MALTKDDLDAFHQFAEAKLASRGAESLQELVDIWDIEHPTTELRTSDVTAIRAAIRDMENGDARRPARQAVQELRSELANENRS